MMSHIDGVDLKEPTAVLAAKGRFAPGVPIVLGSNMEEGGQVGPQLRPGGLHQGRLPRVDGRVRGQRLGS